MLNKIDRVILLLAFALLSLLVPTAIARADGGAPNLAYVAGSGKGISIIDVLQKKVSRTITPTGTPHMVILSADGSYLYVTQPQQGQVAIMAANTGNSICNADVPGQPDMLTIDLSLNTLYAAGPGATSISAIDPATCKIKYTFQAHDKIYGIAVATIGSSLSGSTGNQLWIATSTSLITLDDISGQVLGSVVIPGGPRHIVIPAGATVYVTTQNGTIQAVDLTTRKVIPLISGGQYGPMDYDAGTGEVYVPDQQNNQLVILAPITPGFTLPHQPQRIIKLNATPAAVAITSDGQLGFVALQGGNVAMLDIPGRQTITTIAVGGNPQFIITGLYPPAVPQNSPQSTALNIAAYALIIVLFIVPILLFRRYSKKRIVAAKGE